MFRSFLLDVVHRLSSSASLSLSQLLLSSASKFLVQSSNFPFVGFVWVCLGLFAIVYDDDHINYVFTVLKSKLNYKNRKKCEI